MAATKEYTRVRVRIRRAEGRRGMFQNPMTLTLLKGLYDSSQRVSLPKDWTFDQVAESKLYRDSEGRIAVPVDWIYPCLITAGREVSLAKKTEKVSTAKTTKLFRFLNIEEEEQGSLPLSNGTPGVPPEWKTDARRGRLKDGTAVCVIRPLIPEWSCEFTLRVRTDRITLDKVRQVVETAGEIGLGDFRPDCKGPFGIFEIDEWEVLEKIGGNGDAATKPAPKTARARRA